ncbi:MAG: PQQ-binding-like beta-propeller repeat protein, partial [Candidatus Hydrogenedentota bacterium]
VTDGERVYVYFGMVGLYCYDFDGNVVWEKQLGGYAMDGDWGTGSSPILHEGTLYLQIDNEEVSFLLAMDAKTGEEVWRVQRDERSSWSSPMIWKNSVRTELVTNADIVRSYDPENGNLLWSLKYPGGRASASPVGNSDTLFLGNERRRDGGGVLFAVKAGASGDIAPAPGAETSEGVLWSLSEGGPEFASPLLYEGYLYVFGRNRGSVGCYDPKTGERVEGLDRLSGARSFWSSPWGYDGNVYCIDEAGTAFIIQAAPEIEFLATNPLGEDVRASPAFVDGAIIIRAENKVYYIGE